MARNFIDRCFEAVAPVHAVRRSAARTALQFLNSGYGNYGANLTKKSMRGWEYHGGSSKEDIEDNIDVLRQRSRDAYMGVPVAASGLKTLRTNVVAGGLMPARFWACRQSRRRSCRRRSSGSSPCGRTRRSATWTGWAISTSCNSLPTWAT